MDPHKLGSKHLTNIGLLLLLMLLVLLLGNGRGGGGVVQHLVGPSLIVTMITKVHCFKCKYLSLLVLGHYVQIQ